MPVGPEQVRGRVLWSVTHLGNVMDWLQWPRSLVLVIVPAVLLLLQGRLGGTTRPATVAEAGRS